MIVLPAIDLRNGKCVRLYKGDFAQETVYNTVPEEAALRWEREGAEFLHVVDLDGALAGKPQNTEVIKQRCRDKEHSQQYPHSDRGRRWNTYARSHRNHIESWCIPRYPRLCRCPESQPRQGSLPTLWRAHRCRN